jgi:hypothetical protein
MKGGEEAYPRARRCCAWRFPSLSSSDWASKGWSYSIMLATIVISKQGVQTGLDHPLAGIVEVTKKELENFG